MVVTGNVTRTDIPVLLTTAEWDDPRYFAPEAQLFKELLEKNARPRYRQSLGHNHVSQLLSVGTADTSVHVDGVECVDLRWSTPRAALDAHERGQLALVFPTKRHLEELSGFATVDELLAQARATDVQPVQPRIVLDGDRAQVYLPGEPGYAET